MPPVDATWAPSYLAVARLDLQIALVDLRAWLRRNWPQRRSAVRFADRYARR
jgi:hypothetical protein